MLTAGGPQNDDEIASLARSPLDWSTVAHLAIQEAALPILYRRLRHVAGERLPLAAHEHLRSVALVAEFRLSVLEKKLRRLVTAYNTARIDFILLKGAGLAYSLYESFTARPMTDVDLLVRRSRARQAHSVALSQQWKHRGDVPINREYSGHQHLAPLGDAHGLGLGLEIHTDVFTTQQPFMFTAESVWRDARLVRAGNLSIKVPHIHHQLLHACLHFAWSHEMRFGAWRTFRDIDAIARTGEVRWDDFVAGATTACGASCCYWALNLASRLSGAEVPRDVLRALRPRMMAPLRRPLERHFSVQQLPTEAKCPSASLERLLWRVSVRPGASGHGRTFPWTSTVAWSRERDPAPRLRMREKVRRLTAYLANVLLAGPMLGRA